VEESGLKARELDGSDVHELVGAAEARMGLIVAGGARGSGVEVRQVSEFLAYLVGGVVAGLVSFCWWNILIASYPENFSSCCGLVRRNLSESRTQSSSGRRISVFRHAPRQFLPADMSRQPSGRSLPHTEYFEFVEELGEDHRQQERKVSG